MIGRARLACAKNADTVSGFGVILVTRWIGDSPYSDPVDAYFDHAQRAEQKGRFDFNLQLATNRHRGGTPDHGITFARLSYNHGISANAQLRFSWFHQHTNSHDLSLSRDSRDGFNPAFFSETREDHKIKADFTLHHRDFRIRALSPQLNIGIEKTNPTAVLSIITTNILQ